MLGGCRSSAALSTGSRCDVAAHDHEANLSRDAVPGSGAASARLHRRRRHLPGPGLPAIRPAAAGASLRRLRRALRAINPSPYMIYVATPECTLVGASPEMLVQVTGQSVRYHPIAGTRRRGRTPEDDARMERELRASDKEAAEHLMLIDLGRNDLGRVCATGSVRVTQHMEVERYSHVMHLVSSIEGTLDDGRDSLDALRSCFPAGTVTGAPKIRAMEIIAELEPEVRGPYAGAIGYVGYGGDLDTAIALRTIVVRNGHRIRAGGGRYRRRFVGHTRRRWRSTTRSPRRSSRWRRRTRGRGAERSGAGHRQLRLVHVQPRAVPARARRHGRRRAQRRAVRRRHRASGPRRDRDVARAADSRGGGHLRRPRPRARRHRADARRVPRPPGDRRRLWRHGGARARGGSRQGRRRCTTAAPACSAASTIPSWQPGTTRWSSRRRGFPTCSRRPPGATTA